MRKLILLIGIVLLLVGCNENKLLSEDFKKDINQVLPIIEEAHDSQSDFSSKDNELINRFYDKYKYGQYKLKDDTYYEMNDLEKTVFRKINSMWIFAVELENDELIVLESEKEHEEDYYVKSKETLNEIMKIKNINKLPEEYKGKFPTYEIIKGLYPDVFLVDTKKIIDMFNSLINGSRTTVREEDMQELDEYLEQYMADAISYPTEYEQDEKHYLVNRAMRDAINMFNELKSDINDGGLRNSTITEFNYVKEDVELFIND